MTLEQLFQTNGNNCGFRVRSTKTNNVLEVVGRTPKGKFVLQSITNPEKEEAFAKGDVDRYLMVDEATDARRTELEARATALEDEISTLEEQLEAKQAEYDDIQDELDNVGGE